METKLEPWIETFTGKKFFFLDPKPNQFDIRDIAHALAYTCRYTGHSKRFYSVAEHSVLVSYLAADPLTGLLHDGSEAYITDIASPIKPYISNYKDLEDMIMGRMSAVFGFQYPLPPDIKDCDATQLKTEAKYLLHSKGIPWAHLYPTRREHGVAPMCLSPEQAEKLFLDRYDEVKNVSLSFTNWPYEDSYRSCCPGSLHSVCGDEGPQLDGRQVREEDCCGQGDCSREDKGSGRVGLQDVAEALSKAFCRHES